MDVVASSVPARAPAVTELVPASCTTDPAISAEPGGLDPTAGGGGVANKADVSVFRVVPYVVPRPAF